MILSRRIRFVALATLLFSSLITSHTQAQVTNKHTDTPGDSRPLGEWVEFRKARYIDEPLLLHLRSGYGRAVLMPEPIKLLNEEQSLPGCAVEIDTDVIGFFPTRTFTRKPISFVGLQSGMVYELRVRASPQGIRQPLQITH